MRRVARAGLWIAIALGGGCAKGGSVDALAPAVAAEAGTLDGGTGDADARPPDDGAADACTLGTAAACGTCATVCGTTDAQTTYGCTDATPAGTCTLTCRGEFYDLDGKPDNGCEAEDAIVQDTAASARPITLDATTKSASVQGKAYSDTRPHEVVPLTRPTGREDWYHVTVSVPDGGAAGAFSACLGIPTFPTDDVFEVCTTDANASAFGNCGQVKGGAAPMCVKPAGNADAGEYFVRVHKISGTSTADPYALTVQH
jgi:hypothetical protein